MSTAFDGVDVVCVGTDLLGDAVDVLQSHFHIDAVFFPVEIENFGIQHGAVGIEQGDELLDTALKVEKFFQGGTIGNFPLIAESDADTLIPVVAFSYPPQRAMIVEEGRLVFEYPQYLDSRSQDLVPHYHDVGQFYVFRTEAFKQNRKLMVGNILPLVVSELEVQDIDNQTDWEIAEMKYRLMKDK